MLVDKMVLIAAAGVAVDAAYKMASAPEATPESLHVLHQAFSPLTKGEITLGPALIGEYCGMADIVNAFPTNRDLFLTQETDNAVVRAVHRVTAPFVCNPQATIRGYLDVMGPVIVGASESPMRSVYDTVYDEPSQCVHIKNPLGHAMLSMCIPNCLEAKKKANMRKVQSDLLALQLSAKLGEPCGIKDWFTGRDYLHDRKTDLPFCAGPDGREGGGDDIFLNQ